MGVVGNPRCAKPARVLVLTLSVQSEGRERLRESFSRGARLAYTPQRRRRKRLFIGRDLKMVLRLRL